MKPGNVPDPPQPSTTPAAAGLTDSSDAAEPVEGAPASFNLLLASAGDRRIQVVKVVKDVTACAIINAGNPSAERAKTGAEVLDELKALNLPLGYGDPSIDSPELARQLSAQFSSRKHNP